MRFHPVTIASLVAALLTPACASAPPASRSRRPDVAIVYADVVNELSALLQKIRREGRSRP